MKIAIIGCGMIADAHVKEINKIEGAHVVAVCDKEILMAEQLADRYDIQHYFNDFEILAEKCKPDVVHILTPPTTHLETGLSALEAGCHVLMEKPFAMNRQEAELLIDKARSVKKIISVNHFHNFSSPSLRLREMISGGHLGDVLHIEGFYSYVMNNSIALSLLGDKRNWIHRLPGKIIQNNIDHLICKFVEFLPEAEPKVVAHARRISKESQHLMHSHCDDELRVLITAGDVSVYATFSSNIKPFQHSMTVYGTRATVHVNYDSSTVVKLPVSDLPGPFGKLASPFLATKRYFAEGAKNLIRFGKSDFHYYRGANNFFRRFYEYAGAGDTPPIPYEEIMKVSYIMDEIFSQAMHQENTMASKVLPLKKMQANRNDR